MPSFSFPAARADFLRPFATGAAFFLAYVVLDRLSFIYPWHDLNITPWNPQPALAIALIALRGYRWVGWVFFTVLAAEFVLRGSAVQFPLAIVLTAILVSGYTLVCWLLKGPLAIAFHLGARKDVLHLAGAVVAAAGITGSVYVGVLCLGGILPGSEYLDAVFRFWVGDSIGILVTLPLLLLFADRSRRRELLALVRNPQFVWPVAVIVVILVVVFAMEEAEQFKFFYLLFLPLAWIAARHGLAGAIPAVALVQAGAIVAVLVRQSAIVSVIELQILLFALAMTGLLLGVAVDEYRAASERLARAQQLTAASEMAAALAHELNQPLTALSTYADAIRLLAHTGQCEKASLVDAAERIQRMAKRSVEIVARLKSMGHTCNARKERIPLAVPLEAALAAVAERAERIGATISVEQREQLPLLTLDRDRIAIVLQNLLGNALDAVERNGGGERRIHVRLARDGASHVLLTIRDSGRGVSPELAERIFEPFYTGKAQGMGLGLALSRSIVESHGGRLWLEPARNGLFHLRLPI